MLKVKVHWPEDMTEVYRRIGEIQADFIIKECKEHNVDVGAVIKYLESRDNNRTNKR